MRDSLKTEYHIIMEEKEVQEQLSNRDRFLQRMKARRSDVDFEDPEARYGAFMQDFDELETKLGKHRDSDAKFAELFKKDPRFAALINDAMEGGDIPTSLVRRFGKDILEADDEGLAKIAEANQEYLNKVAESNRLYEEQQANLEESEKAMSEFKESKGMDEAAFEDFIGKVYQTLEDGFMGRLSLEFMEVFYKGLSYDQDIRKAADAGLVEGRNQKIELENKAEVGDTLPNLSDTSKGGKPRPAPRPIKRNFFD